MTTTLTVVMVVMLLGALTGVDAQTSCAGTSQWMRMREICGIKNIYMYTHKREGRNTERYFGGGGRSSIVEAE